MENHAGEKRRYLRMQKRLPMHLSDKQFDTVAYTRDISQRGALCELKYEIPLMSKMGIKLLLPSPSEGKSSSFTIKCVGVVVRSQPIIKDTSAFYDTAIFFTKLSKGDEKKIAQYIEGTAANQDQNSISDIQLN
jgi:hypothetical protein